MHPQNLDSHPNEHLVSLPTAENDARKALENSIGKNTPNAEKPPTEEKLPPGNGELQYAKSLKRPRGPNMTTLPTGYGKKTAAARRPSSPSPMAGRHSPDMRIGKAWNAFNHPPGHRKSAQTLRRAQKSIPPAATLARKALSRRTV